MRKAIRDTELGNGAVGNVELDPFGLQFLAKFGKVFHFESNMVECAAFSGNKRTIGLSEAQIGAR